MESSDNPCEASRVPSSDFLIIARHTLQTSFYFEKATKFQAFEFPEYHAVCEP